VQKEFSEQILEIRGCGCMQGIALNFEASILVAELLKHNIITNATAINVLRLLPPLTISKEEIDEFIHGLKISLKSLQL
jgi:4-aminobutyrate aminotransferase-like enzyme